MTEIKKITPGEPIYSKESKEYQDKLSYLIGRHNVLCSVERAFNENEAALKCFNEAVDEVLSSGNQSVSSMFFLAIERLSEKAADLEEDNPDIDKMRLKIHQLEAENKNLTTRLDMIAQLVEKQKRNKK